MLGTLLRPMGWVLLGAWVWFAAASGRSLGGDEPASGGRSKEPSTAPTIRIDGPIITSGKKNDAGSADKADTPTLAPPRRNALRDAQGDGSSPLVDSSSRKPAFADDSAGRAAPSSASPPATRPDSPRGTKTPTRTSAAEAAGKSPRPVPADVPAPAEIETASFNGVTPGTTTLAEVEKAWGKPREVKPLGETVAHLYKVDPFEHVELIFYREKVASIVIRLERAFPADAVAKQLTLGNLQPVLISNDLGEILGECFPERGVVFSFEPSPTAGKVSMKVVQIILEPVTAEPFLLRAETNLDSQHESSLRDLQHAVKLAPNNARAHWLKARLLVLMGDLEQAASAADEAVRAAPKDAQYRLTRAQILGQAGRFSEAIQDAEQAITDSGERLHVKARALCLMGDLLGSGPKADHKRAVDYHMQAIKTADALATSRHPAIRLPAKEVLIDAHLGAAHDIAWGNFNQKQTAVETWLKRASAYANDFVQNDGGNPEHQFRVATRALAACVGVQGKLDPGPWADQSLRLGRELIAEVGETPQKRQFEWELGMALYDAVQICQMRGEREQALKHGQQAAEYLQRTQAGKPSAADAYLLGRLYFRLGSIHAIGQQNHRAAVSWFDKAVPVLEQATASVAPHELGRLGETFVSMGVSYWETGSREQAVKLTRQGADLLEKAVQEGQVPKTALDVPYANLAAMHRQLGQNKEAEKYSERSAARGGGARR